LVSPFTDPNLSINNGLANRVIISLVTTAPLSIELNALDSNMYVVAIASTLPWSFPLRFVVCGNEQVTERLSYSYNELHLINEPHVLEIERGNIITDIKGHDDWWLIDWNSADSAFCFTENPVYYLCYD